jgi:hypothetical protein
MTTEDLAAIDASINGAFVPAVESDVAVGPSLVGQGVFALRRFSADEVVGRVDGQVIDDPDYGSVYSMELGGTLTLEPFAPFRFLNHRCQPNCTLAIEEDEAGVPRILVEALETIELGDELVIDYAWPAEFAIACQCGSPRCRGWIVAEEELDNVTV